MREPLALQQIALVRVVPDQVLQGVKLSPPDVKVPADGRDPKVVDASLSEEGEDVGTGFAVRLAHEVGAILTGIAETFLRLVAVHTAVIPSEIGRRQVEGEDLTDAEGV